MTMRNTPTKLEQRISASLAERGELRYAELMTATQAANSPLLARTLKRMRRYGVITRTIFGRGAAVRTLLAPQGADD